MKTGDITMIEAVNETKNKLVIDSYGKLTTSEKIEAINYYKKGLHVADAIQAAMWANVLKGKQ